MGSTGLSGSQLPLPASVHPVASTFPPLGWSRLQSTTLLAKHPAWTFEEVQAHAVSWSAHFDTPKSFCRLERLQRQRLSCIWTAGMNK